MAGPFEFILGGEPPTPEQRKAQALHRLKHRQHHERQVKEALPVIQEIRKGMRELARMGFQDDRLTKSRRKFAQMADDLQTWLEMPPPPDSDPCDE